MIKAPQFDETSGNLRVRLRTQATESHTNLVPCIILGHERALSIETPNGVVTGEALLVNANWEHVVNFHGGAADVIYLEKGNGSLAPGFCAKRIANEGVRFVCDHSLVWSADTADELADIIGVKNASEDCVITQIQDRILADPMARLGECEASSLVGLERTTMLRRFKRQTGMTFRAYKSWIGLKHATRLFMGGEQIGHSGLDAGFSDAAHFSRQFRSTFGLSPSQARVCVI